MCIKYNTYTPLSALFRKVYLISFTAILFLLFIASINTVQSGQSVENLYENGLTEKEKGNYEKALEIWSQAETSMREPDFRIAQAFIELTTDKKLKENYQQATELYYWGLSGTVSENEKEYLLSELELLQPLLKNRNFSNFRNKIRDADAEVLAEIKKYWMNRDPTPLNSYNERLIEHWERISYARENYSKLKSKDLDARGKVYLKYGNPYYTRSGRLNYKSSLVHRLLLEGIRTPSFGSPEQINITSTQRYNLEVQIRQLHPYPYYEIWMYRGLTSDEDENTIFIFGTEGNTNSSFEKINSLEDFIPNEAYRKITQNNYTLTSNNNSDSEGSEAGETDTEFDDVRQNRTSAGQVDITPALILQLMYYDQFAAFDDYFGRAYNEMMDRFIDMASTPNTNMRGLAREFGTIYGTKLIQNQSAAPLEKSEQKDEILPLPSENYTYRFLDENNNPYLRTYSVINLEKAVYYDLLKETNSLQADMNNRYALLSGYLLKDENNNDVDKHIERRTISSPGQTVNFLEIPYQSELQAVTLSHELHKSNEINDSTISSNTAYSKSLKGLSNYTIDLPEPLGSDELALSDLIIGYSYSSDDYNYSGDSLNFTIAHDKDIPQDADINLYYELYNLEPGNNGVSDFTFHYSIHEKSSRRFLGIFKRRPDDEISITINNSVAGNRYKNVLTIKTSTLEPGEYELDIEIEDLNSGADFSRTVSFNIPEN
jgi:GWxTD domain-containing protein